MPSSGKTSSNESEYDSDDGSEGVCDPGEDYYISMEEDFRISLLAGARAAKRKYSDSPTKRIHFDDEVQVSDDSEPESSELDSSMFPDLVVVPSTGALCAFPVFTTKTAMSSVLS